jgi:hypothetical protein
MRGGKNGGQARKQRMVKHRNNRRRAKVNEERITDYTYTLLPLLPLCPGTSLLAPVIPEERREEEEDKKNLLLSRFVLSEL